jgi:hypothetical protein
LHNFLDDILDDTGIPCVLDKNGSTDLLNSYPSNKYNLGDYIEPSQINEQHLIMEDKNNEQKKIFFSANDDTKKVILRGYAIDNINKFFKYMVQTKKIDTDNTDKQKQLSDEIYKTKVYNVIDYMQYTKDNPLEIIMMIGFAFFVLFIIYYLFIKK